MPKHSRRSTARWRRPASTAGNVSSGGSLTGQGKFGPRPWPLTARIAPHRGGWRRIPCSESNRPRINAADTLSQWVLSSTQLALLHPFRQISKSGGFARSENSERGNRNDRKS
jgi:hypothetical protein